MMMSLKLNILCLNSKITLGLHSVAKQEMLEILPKIDEKYKC